LLLVLVSFAWGQPNRGEVRLMITDPAGAALPARVELDSRANGYHASTETDAAGRISIPALAFGDYSVTIQAAGFAANHTAIQVRSAVPVVHRVSLAIAGTETEIVVNDRRSPSVRFRVNELRTSPN
jgi:hypothetical protein